MIIEIFQFWIELYILQTKQIPCLSANKFFFCFIVFGCPLSGLSPLIFPAWLHLPEAKPLPAEFAGSQRHTSPSTTARWQSMRGVLVIII